MREKETHINKGSKKAWSIIADMALTVTKLSANSTCSWKLYQDELPKDYKKLRKF